MYVLYDMNVCTIHECFPVPQHRFFKYYISMYVCMYYRIYYFIVIIMIRNDNNSISDSLGILTNRGDVR